MSREAQNCSFIMWHVMLQYLLLSCEVVNPRVCGGIDLLCLPLFCCPLLSSLGSIVVDTKALGLLEGVVGKYSFCGVLKLAEVTNERKASNWRNDKAL